MASTDHADALRSVQSIIEREFRPRPGQSDMIAPNGKAYRIIRTKPAGTVVQALQDLGTRLRAMIGEYQGDTVWWRRKPELDQDDKTKFWTARASLALGYASTERPEFMPSKENPAAYPEDCGAGTVPPILGGQTLPRWKCHKEVQAAKITGFQFPPEGPVACMGDIGAKATLEPKVLARMIGMTNPKPGDGEAWANLVGGYYVRYADGFESWSPAKAFEDGYTKMVP